MFLPWAGLFEQIRLADVFVHYEDVNLPRGRSFIHRVQIKTPRGQQWLSADLDRRNSGTHINQTLFKKASGWRERHLNLLHENYRHARHYNLMREIVSAIYACETTNLAEFNRTAIEFLADRLGLSADFQTSPSLSIPGKGGERLLEICRYFGAREYITGHGAANYLDHELFEKHGIAVSYMDYQKQSYEQLHGDFIPYVSILDAIANIGEDAGNLLVSGAIPWREYIHESTR